MLYCSFWANFHSRRRSQTLAPGIQNPGADQKWFWALNPGADQKWFWALNHGGIINGAVNGSGL